MSLVSVVMLTNRVGWEQGSIWQKLNFDYMIFMIFIGSDFGIIS